MLSKINKYVSWRKADFCGLGLILLAAVIFFFPVWYGGKTFYAFDTLKNYYPWLIADFTPNNRLLTDPVNAPYPYCLYMANSFYYESLHLLNQFPLWQGSLFGGMSFTGFYTSPFKVIYYALFNPLTAHDLFLFLHLIAAGMFCFGYLRQLRLRAPGALLGGLLWMFNGYVMCWFEFEAFLLLAATLPAALLFLERLWHRQKLLDWLLLTATLGWAIGIGYAHLFMLQLLFLAAMTVYKISRQRFCRIAFQKVTMILASVLVSFLMGLNFFWSHLEQYDGSTRQAYEFSELYANTGQVLPAYLPTMLYPDFFGSPTTKTEFTPNKSDKQTYNNYSELCIYSGIITLFLTLTAFWGWRRYPMSRFYLVAGIMILLMCMGSPLYYPLYALVPGLKLTTPTRLLQLFGFCMAVNAAFGLNLLWRRQIRKPYLSIILTTGLFLAGIILPWWARNTAGIKAIHNVSDIPPQLVAFFSGFYSYTSPIIFYSIIFMLAAFLCILLLMVKNQLVRLAAIILLIFAGTTELMWFGWKYNTVSERTMAFPSTPGLRFLQSQTEPARTISFGPFYPNSLAPLGIASAGGYSTSFPSRYQQIVRQSQGPADENNKLAGRLLLFSQYNSPLIDLLNVKYLLVPPGKIDYNKEELDLAYDGEIKIFANKRAFPHAWFVPTAKPCRNAEEVLTTMTKFSREDFRRQVVLEDYRLPLTNGSSGNVKIQKYTPNEVVIEANSADGGFVVLADNWHKDWVCSIDGQPTPIYLANYIMRAVRIGPGNHIITMEFRPMKYIYSFYLSLLIWIIILSSICYCIVKKRRRINTKWI